MSAEAVTGVMPYPGRTTIRPVAIRRIAEAVAAEVAGVPASAVRAELADARGVLTVRVTTPVALEASTGARGTLVERAAALVETVASRLDALTGRSVGRVDVRFSGVRHAEERRVR